jgi:hypothetical protein
MRDDGKPRIKARWTRSRHVRITATRGAVTTEATLTEAEANQLAHQLGKLLNGSPGPAAT